MRTTLTHRVWLAGKGLLLNAIIASAIEAAAGPPTEVKGRLTEIDGVPVVTVWGNASEQGYAHGYLVAQRAVPLLDQMLKNGVIFTVDTYQNKLLAHINLMKIEPKYEQELRGILAGIEARLGGPARVPALGRAVKYEDLVALNSVDLDCANFRCSAFAAWGPMTKDGHTISGRNMEWPLDRALFESQMVLVRLPSADGKTPGLVSVFYPTCIGTTTAMNGDGLSAAMHDVVPRDPTAQERYVCRTLAHRDALEAARPRSFTADIAAILRQQPCFMGDNMMVTRPFAGSGPGAVVFEHDGYMPDGDGVTVREPEADACFIVCTNHYLKREQRQPESDCPRYATLMRKLEEIAKSHGRKHVTVDAAWRILKSAPIQHLVTYHRVVFEPNKRRMHVAFPKNGDPKTQGKVVVLDVAKLLQRPSE